MKLLTSVRRNAPRKGRAGGQATGTSVKGKKGYVCGGRSPSRYPSDLSRPNGPLRAGRNGLEEDGLA
jgi:hypothetical protein